MGIRVVAMDETGAVMFATDYLGCPRENIEGVLDHGLAKHPNGKYKEDAHEYEVVLKDAKPIVRRLNAKKGYVSVHVGPRLVTMTAKGYAFLKSVGRGRYARGAEVAIVRKLEDLKLATLRDDGRGPLWCGKVDGERWWVERTALGDLVCTAEKEL